MSAAGAPAAQEPAAPEPAAPAEQSALERFSDRFRAAVREAERAGASVEALARSYRRLEDLEASIDLIPDERGHRGQARFFTGVQKAVIRVRQHRLADAFELGLKARRRAVEDRVYAGSYRALLLVTLWECLPADRFADAFDRAERDYLGSQQALDDAPFLRVPLRMLAFDLEVRDGGDEARALRSLRQLADELAAAGGAGADDPWRHKLFGALAWSFWLRGDAARAEVYLAELPERVAIYPRGLIAFRRGDFETALRAGQELARGDARYGQLVGDALEQLGRFDEAEAAYRAVLSVARDPVDVACAQGGLGDCWLGRFQSSVAASDLARARTAFSAALHALSEAPEQALHDEDQRAYLTAGLGRVAECAGDLAGAFELYRASQQTLDRARGSVAMDPFGRSWLAGGLTGRLAGVDGMLRTGAAAGRDPVELLAAMEMGKARELLDWMSAPPTAADARALQFAVRDLARIADADRIDASLRALEDARRERLRAVPARSVPCLGPDELRRHLRAADGAVCLSYWLARAQDDCWLCWVEGGPAGASGCVRLGSAEEALALLGRARASLGLEGAPDDPWPALDAAARFFVPDAVRGPIARARRLVFCPDDRLGRLPFEALRAGGESLGIALPVERAPSLSVRDALARRRAEGRGTALIDSVEAPADERALGLEPLAFSAREAALVVRAYGDVERLTGADTRLADLERLLQGRAFDLVHISAHAVANPLVPTSSLLVLADGPAALPSLCAAPLRGAVLVLSACSSAAGESRRGEGELGLLGWPFAAGARGAVASLWPVDQQATADLMGQFHALRARGADEAEAMRAARARLRDAPNYAHPRYWAGFGVFGAPSAADSGAGAGFLSWSGAVVVALALLALGLGVLAWRRRALSSRAGGPDRPSAGAAQRPAST